MNKGRGRYPWQHDDNFIAWASAHTGNTADETRACTAGMEMVWEAWCAARGRQYRAEVIGEWSSKHKHWTTPRKFRTNGPDRLEACPFCGCSCVADWVDVGVGHVQCGPFHCLRCLASEQGPYDTDTRETCHGWYLPGTPAGSSSNTYKGRPVSHQTAKLLYERGELDEGSSTAGIDGGDAWQNMASQLDLRDLEQPVAVPPDNTWEAVLSDVLAPEIEAAYVATQEETKSLQERQAICRTCNNTGVDLKRERCGCLE